MGKNFSEKRGVSSGIVSVAVLPDALVSNAEIYNYDMSIDGYCGSVTLGPGIYNLALIDSSSAAAQTEPLSYFEFAQSSVNMNGALIIIPVPITYYPAGLYWYEISDVVTKTPKASKLNKVCQKGTIDQLVD